MNIDEIAKKAKDLISEQNLTEAKKFIEAHKSELGEHYDKLIRLVSSNSDSMVGKVKDLFSKKIGTRSHSIVI